MEVQTEGCSMGSPAHQVIIEHEIEGITAKVDDRANGYPEHRMRRAVLGLVLAEHKIEIYQRIADHRNRRIAAA